MTIDSRIIQSVRAGARRTDSAAANFFRSPLTCGLLLVLVLLISFCAVGPLLVANLSGTSFAVLSPPSAGHPMGTDSLGRDLMSRMMVGGQVSLFVGVAVSLLCFTLALIVGGVAGFYGGLADKLLSKVSEFFQVIPAIILALVSVAMLGASLPIIIVILCLTMWPQVARIMRAECMRIRELGYVESARAAGFSSVRILCSDVLPNAFPPVLVATTMTVGRAILLESGLSFLGLGDANRPSWGALLNDSQAYIQLGWWLAFFPGAAIFLVVLIVNLLGDRLNDTLNPALSKVK